MTDQGQDVAGIGLFLAAFVDERGADQALESINQAKDRGEFFFDDAAVVRRDAAGKVDMSDTGDISAGKVAGIGAIAGGVIGLLAGPAGIVLGAGAGAAIGGLAAAADDAGFDRKSLEEIGGALPPGTSALVATTSQAAVEEIRRRAEPHERLTMAREIASEINAHLEMRKDVLLAMAITEAGVAAAKLVSSPTELAAFGIAATEEDVVARAGVVTPEGAAAVEAVATPADEADTTGDSSSPTDQEDTAT